MTNPFQEITEQLQRIEKKLESLTQQPAPVELPDRMNFDEAREFLHFSSSKLYKLTASGNIPHGVFGGKRGRLVFSRREISEWMEDNTIKSDPEKDVADSLANSVRRRKS